MTYRAVLSLGACLVAATIASCASGGQGMKCGSTPGPRAAERPGWLFSAPCADSRGMERNVRIDCGANRGLVLAAAVAALQGFEHLALEANAELIPVLRDVARRLAPARVVVRHAAVWTHDGNIDLFLTDRKQDPGREGGTLLAGKTTFGVDYGRPVRTPCVDLDRLVREEIADASRLYLKVDIEGAEYAVLEKMLAGGSLGRVDALVLETHAHKVLSITRERHDVLLERLDGDFGAPVVKHGTFVGWARDAAAAAYVREALAGDVRLAAAG